MLKQLLFFIVLTFLSPQVIQACSCLEASSFCESISREGQLNYDVIIRGKVLPSNDESVKIIRVAEVLFGVLNDSNIELGYGMCDLDYQDLSENDEFIFALRKSDERFFLIGCAISFLKIENEVVSGKIAPGVNSLDYDQFITEATCDINFNGILSGNLEIYPNPTSDKIRIHNVSSTHSYGDLKVQLFDAVGRSIEYHENDGILLAQEEKVIDIGDFTSGVYIVQISNGLRTRSYKVVKI